MWSMRTSGSASTMRSSRSRATGAAIRSPRGRVYVPSALAGPRISAERAPRSRPSVPARCSDGMRTAWVRPIRSSAPDRGAPHAPVTTPGGFLSVPEPVVLAPRSAVSGVVCATRGPTPDWPPRTPVSAMPSGFVTHRACRPVARHCILNVIDAPSPDGRNRSTSRRVKV